MSRFLAPRHGAIRPYTPGEQPRDREYIKLNTNESPYPPAPGVLEAINPQAVSELMLYSDPEARALHQAIADHYQLDRNQVLAGNGSDEILAFAFQAFCDAGHPVAFPDISYGFYPVFAQIYGIPARVIPLDERFQVRAADYFDSGAMVVIANPNAPTGQYLELEDIGEICRRNRDNVVLIDEAYVDFGGESAAALLPEHENLLVTQTFSKSRNLAGARIGFALGSPELIGDLRKMKYSFNPYNLNRLSILAGAAAMRDQTYFGECREKIIAVREWTIDALRQRGFLALDSRANFIFAAPPEGLSGGEYYLGLKKRGVLVRHFSLPRIENFVRITVGTKEQMEALLRSSDELLKEAGR